MSNKKNKDLNGVTWMTFITIVVSFVTSVSFLGLVFSKEAGQKLPFIFIIGCSIWYFIYGINVLLRLIEHKQLQEDLEKYESLTLNKEGHLLTLSNQDLIQIFDLSLDDNNKLVTLRWHQKFTNRLPTKLLKDIEADLILKRELNLKYN